MSIILLPLDFENGIPKDRILFDAVAAFCVQEFGKAVDFRNRGKTWAAVKISEEGSGYEVVGVSSLAFAVDCPTFHVHRPADDAADADFDEARRVRDMLTSRMSGYIQDTAGPNTEVLVYIAPDQQRFWASYLRLLKAKPSNRFIVKV